MTENRDGFQLPDGVQEDPNVELQEFHRETGLGFVSVGLRERDGIPVGVIGGIALPVDLFCSEDRARFLCVGILVKLFDRGLPPDGREDVRVAIEDEDGGAVGYVIIRAWDGMRFYPRDQKTPQRTVELFTPEHVRVITYPLAGQS